MALKNAALARLAVEHLQLESDARVIEIGYRPGQAIREAARRVRTGLVAGVDHSEVMWRQARARNRRAVETGRVDLRCGDGRALPYPDATFSCAFEVNSLHHWTDPAVGLAELRRVLRADGRLLLCLRMRHPSRTRLVAPGYSEEEVVRVVARVREAGFGEVRTVRARAGREVTLVLARR